MRRRVAIKIIRGSMDTREVIARFETERQALSIMDDPNIARVFDAGETDDGRPFVVMELVRGAPITTYCDHYRLSAEARLQLFITVWQAVLLSAEHRDTAARQRATAASRLPLRLRGGLRWRGRENRTPKRAARASQRGFLILEPGSA